MTKQYKIEDGIPVPEKGTRKAGNSLTQAIIGLNVGQSIFNETFMNTQVMLAKRATGNAYTTRKVDGGYRVWRTA